MAALPLTQNDCPEDTRISYFKQVTLSSLLFALALCLLSAASAQAAPAGDDRPGSAALSIVPQGGRPRGIQLRSQTVDAEISQDSTGVWADTHVWVQLFNPGNQPIVVPVTLPGPQLAAAALPADFEITLNNRPLALAPLPTIGFTAPITVPVSGSAHLRLHYRQALSTQDDLVSFTYPLTATLQWGNTPESLRVTIKFAQALPPEAILTHTPAATRRNRDGLTWHMENRKAAASIGVAFMAPVWWSEFTAARTAAAAPQAGLAEQMALSRGYEQMAGLVAPPYDPAAPFFERYYPGAVAALQAGIARPGAAAQPAELATAHAGLARLYLARAGRVGADQTAAVQQAAAAELETAVQLDGAATELRRAAADLYGQLAALAEARNDRVTAAQHRARLAALAGANTPASAQTLAEAGVLARAAQAIAAGDLALARRLIAETFGAEAATLPGLAPPAAAQIVIGVKTSASQRVIAAQWLAEGASAALDALIAEAARSLAPLAQVQAGSAALTITLPYGDAAALAAAQARLADALPTAPEWALLAAALRPQQLTWQAEPGLLQTTERYVEQVDLQGAWVAWEGLAERLEDAGAGIGAPEGLAAVQRTLLMHDAGAWRALAEHSRIIYEAEIGAETPRWEVAAGAARVLEASTTQVLPGRGLLVAAVTALGVLLAAFTARR